MDHRRCTGTCTECGKENATLIVLDDVDRLCPECLDSGYTQCDICGEYWPDGIVEFTYTEDQIICEYCYEDTDHRIPVPGDPGVKVNYRGRP